MVEDGGGWLKGCIQTYTAEIRLAKLVLQCFIPVFSHGLLEIENGLLCWRYNNRRRRCGRHSVILCGLGLLGSELEHGSRKELERVLFQRIGCKYLIVPSAILRFFSTCPVVTVASFPAAEVVSEVVSETFSTIFSPVGNFLVMPSESLIAAGSKGFCRSLKLDFR